MGRSIAGATSSMGHTETVDIVKGMPLAAAARAARARHTDRIFTDATLKSQLSAAARQRVADCFNVAAFAQQHLTLYDKWPDAAL